MPDSSTNLIYIVEPYGFSVNFFRIVKSLLNLKNKKEEAEQVSHPKLHPPNVDGDSDSALRDF